MGIKFNPFTGAFDLSGSGGTSPSKAAVATEATLPLIGNSDGDVRVALDTDTLWVWDDTTSRWFNAGIKTAVVGSTPNTAGYSLTDTDVSTNRTERTLVLQPASSSKPGIVSTGTQTFAGPKTFIAAIYPEAGIDVAVTAGSDTLAIGATNADVINIGRSGATVNIIGDTFYQNVTNADVADKNITINKGGAAGSASSSGLEIEENSLTTGYCRTSADRNTWQLKAPNNSGTATINPGSGGITLNQTSHDPVTIGTASGLSLATQALSLAVATTGVTGALSSTDWNTFNGKVAGPGSSVDNTLPRFDSTTGKIIQTSGVVVDDSNNVSGIVNLNASGTTTLGAGLTGPLHATAGVVSASAVVLTSEVSGILPVANGGTASNTTLNNSRIMVSAGSKIVEAGVMTNGQLLIGSTSAAPVVAAITQGSGLTITNGAGSISIAMTLAPSAGDIAETSFTAANNQGAAANVTGLTFANGTVRSFEAIVSITRSTTYAQYRLNAVQKAAAWELVQEYIGDDTGLVFTLTTTGQVQYTSTNTGSTATVKFRAITTTV